jgi:hypothetical protein
MATSTDRFKVVSIRPEAHVQVEEVPEDLRAQVEGKVVTAGDLEELGADVQTARLYHGGGSLVVVYWHGDEYVLQLEPAA